MNASTARSQPHDTFGHALIHPTCLIAMAVWWFNDHIGKPYAPSTLTGKLSDVACLVVFPVFVWCLIDGPLTWLLPQSYGNNLRRRRTQFLVTTLVIVTWFTAIKVSEQVGAIHRQLWTDVYAFLATHLHTVGVDRQRAAQHAVDPTDLFTLPAVTLGYHVVTEHLRQVFACPAAAEAVAQLNET